VQEEGGGPQCARAAEAMGAVNDEGAQRTALAPPGGDSLPNHDGWPFSPLNATKAGGRTALQRVPSAEREPFAFMTVSAPTLHGADRLRSEGYRESRRCSRDTYPESYITKYTSIRRENLARGLLQTVRAPTFHASRRHPFMPAGAGGNSWNGSAHVVACIVNFRPAKP